MTTEKKSLRPEAAAISDIAKKHIKIGDDGTATSEDGLYEKTLPDGMTQETADLYAQHNVNFLTGVAHAFGTMSLSAMARNEELATTAIEVAMDGKNRMFATMARERKYPNPQKPEEPVVRQGELTIKHEMAGGMSSAPDFKELRGMLHAAAAKKFANK